MTVQLTGKNLSESITVNGSIVVQPVLVGNTGTGSPYHVVKSNKVRDIRIAKKMKQGTLAKSLGVSQSWLCTRELKDSFEFKRVSRIEMAKALGVSEKALD